MARESFRDSSITIVSPRRSRALNRRDLEGVRPRARLRAGRRRPGTSLATRGPDSGAPAFRRRALGLPIPESGAQGVRATRWRVSFSGSGALLRQMPCRAPKSGPRGNRGPVASAGPTSPRAGRLGGSPPLCWSPDTVSGVHRSQPHETTKLQPYSTLGAPSRRPIVGAETRQRTDHVFRRG